MTGDRRPPWLGALFFGSGATSLVYQTLWARQLHLMLGTSSYAISVVLSAFMGGLGLGGLLAARWSTRVARPMQAYGRLEVGVALWALVFPLLVRLVTPLDVALAALPGADLWHVLVAAALLLPPTTAMGATLPLLARVVADRRGTVGDRIGRLYAANTFGAVAGTIVAGLISLPLQGAFATNLFAVAGNLALGAIAIRWDPDPAEVADDLDEADPVTLRPDPVAVMVAGLAGLAALSCEVTWTRLVGLLLGGTTYAFTAMLTAVLLGVAIGGRIGGILADDAIRYRGGAGVLRSLAGIQLALALIVAGMLFGWPLVPYAFVAAFDAMDGAHHPWSVFVANLICAVLAMLPPAVLMGTAFPFAVRAAVGGSTDVSGPVARVYAANTFGGMIGAAATGFFLIPALGLQGFTALAAAVNGLAGSLALFRSRSPLLGVGVLAVALGLGWVRAPWNLLWMSGGLYQYVSQFEDHDYAGLQKFTTGDQDLLFYDDGRSTVVTVAQNRNDGNKWLANNGKVDASTSGDMPTQVLVALAGAQYAEKLDRVLVIGLASGVTAGAVTQLPTLGKLDVAEIEPAVVRAAAIFDHDNHGVLHDPKVRVIVNDGRNLLLRTPPGTYDLIVSEPSNPYLSGVANLFTREFWAMGKTRLAPGGVWTQWIQLYGMGPDELRGLLRTFAETYPHVALYVAIQGADVVIVGSDRPLDADPALAAKLLDASDGVRAELAEAGVRFPLDLVALHAMDRAQVLAFAGSAPLVTDDNLRVEYAAPLWLHTDISLRNGDDLLAAAHIPLSSLSDDPLDWSDSADAYDRIEDPRRANRLRARMLAWLPPESPLADQISDQLAAAAGDSP